MLLGALLPRTAGSQATLQSYNSLGKFVGWEDAPELALCHPSPRAPQLRPNSNVGELLFDAQLLGDGQSYRAFRFQWSECPTDNPTVAVEQGPDDRVSSTLVGMAPRRSRAGRCWLAPVLTNSSPSEPLHGVASKPPSLCAPLIRTPPYRPRALRGGCSVPPRLLSRRTEQRRAYSRRQYPREYDNP